MYGTRIVPRIRQVQSLEWRSLSIVFEAMSMLRVIVVVRPRAATSTTASRTQGRTAVDARVRLTVWQTLFSLGVTTAIALGTALVLGFGAWHVLQGDITLGELTVLISYIAAVYQPLESISHDGRPPAPAVRVPQRVAAHAGREAGGDREGRTRSTSGARRGELEFEDVSFAYKGRVDTLKDISFEVPGRRSASRSWARRAPARPRW